MLGGGRDGRGGRGGRGGRVVGGAVVGRLRLVVLLVLVLAPMVGSVVAARLVGEITALCIYSVVGCRLQVACRRLQGG